MVWWSGSASAFAIKAPICIALCLILQTVPLSLHFFISDSPKPLLPAMATLLLHCRPYHVRLRVQLTFYVFVILWVLCGIADVCVCMNSSSSDDEVISPTRPMMTPAMIQEKLELGNTKRAAMFARAKQRAKQAGALIASANADPAPPEQVLIRDKKELPKEKQLKQ